ncbi:FAD-dependent oxidoreductase [Streptomyces sp. NPDC057877]|uniref:FAD-dependent oxidoreductase n=1 Tax=Streptomyces sp. NPDC057877 TaxID=3346269 RepID=UPI0036B7DF48
MSTAPLGRVVVVGNGIAGLTAAHTPREAGFDGELTIVGDERHPAYSRPALSKALLLDGDDLTSHELPPPGHGATELLGVRATGLDVDRRLVSLDDGTALPYDRLVLATRSRARRLSALPGELTLRGLDDALALRRRVAAGPSVVVVGGGPLGMEIASGCLTSGCEVTLVSQGTPLRQQVGPYLADVFVRTARERGLTVVETAGAQLEGGGGVPRVVLAEGGVLEAEVVLTAAGDVPDTEWLADSGLTARGAIEVDARGLVPPDVAAVRDLAAFPTPRGRRRVPLWSSAIEQATVAARALVHGDGRGADPRARGRDAAAAVPAVLLDGTVRAEPEGGRHPARGRRAGVRRRGARRRTRSDALAARRRHRRRRRPGLPRTDPPAAPVDPGGRVGCAPMSAEDRGTTNSGLDRLASVNLNLLVPPLALLEERSVTKAAERVGLSQPAMSHALTRMRRLLGDDLVVRQGSGVTLTPRALELVGPLRGALRQTARIVNFPVFDPATDGRIITVAMTTSTAFVVGPWLTPGSSGSAPRTPLCGCAPSRCRPRRPAPIKAATWC